MQADAATLTLINLREDRHVRTVEQRADHRPATSFLIEINSGGREGTLTQLDRACRAHCPLGRMAQMDELRFQSKDAQVATGIHNCRWDTGA